MVIPVGKVRYEVGAEAALAQATDETRNLDDIYVLTDPYLAIVRGALRLMRVQVGLPVSLFKKRRAELEKRLQREHDLGDGKSVHVARVKAMAQPMGAFLSYAVPHAQRDTMLRERNVIVDPGWRTFDHWVVTQSLKVLGQAFELEPFLDAGKRVVHEAITEMRHIVQDGSDIDNFVLAGGAAFFYGGELQKASATSRRSARSGTAAHADLHRDALRTLSAQNGDARCFIATALWGSADPCSQALRQWRDRWLLKRHWGPLATRLYYRLSPRFVSVMVCARRLHVLIDTLLSFLAGRIHSGRE